ncbi:MAG: CoA transferase [Chloroflexota bacterium]
MKTPEHILQDLLRLDPDFTASNDVVITPELPVFATPVQADEALAASLAATGKIAADLWEIRSGQTQSVEVRTRRAVASSLGHMYVHFEDKTLAPPPRIPLTERSAFSEFYTTADDRQIFLHAGFETHTPRWCQALACEDNRDAVTQVVAAHTATALEAKIAQAGLFSGVVRTPQEWDEAAQGQVLASVPVVEIIKIGDSDPIPLTKEERPLSGIRALDLTRVLAGPVCGRTLAQYGADVLRIGSDRIPDVPVFMADTGHGKRFAALDLKTPLGKARLHRLISGADVMVQSYRAGALDRLGFGPTELAKRKPGLIYTTINCFGHDGPWQGFGGFEQIAQSVTGIAHLARDETSARILKLPLTDYTTGYLAAFGTLLALKQRTLHGGSYLVRVSLCRTGMWVRNFGVVPETVQAAAQDLSVTEVDDFSTVSDTGWGRMHHFAPAIHLSRTPAHWRLPTVPLGTNAPRW